MDSKNLMQKQSKEIEINTHINEEKTENIEINAGQIQLGDKQADEIKINADLDTLEAKIENPLIEEKIGKAKEDLKAGVKVYDKKRIKAVGDQDLIDTSKFVSFYRTNEVVKKDSEKMQTVKIAINRYLEHKDEIVAPSLLQTIVMACDQYINGKISFLRLGDAGRRLKEVKEVRKQADRELSRIKAEESKMTEEDLKARKKERVDKLKENEKYYLPEVDAYYRELAADTSYRKYLPETKVVIDVLRKYYPAMSYREAEHLAIRNREKMLVRADKSMDFKQLDKLVSKESKKSAVIRQQREIDEKIRDRADTIKKSIPGMGDKLALKVAKKEHENGEEFTDRQIIAKYMDSVTWGLYKIKRANLKAKENARNYNMVHRFFAWITNYAFEKKEALAEELDQLMFENNIDQITERKNKDTGNTYFDMEEHGLYEDEFI